MADKQKITVILIITGVIVALSTFVWMIIDLQGYINAVK